MTRVVEDQCVGYACGLLVTRRVHQFQIEQDEVNHIEHLPVPFPSRGAACIEGNPKTGLFAERDDLAQKTCLLHRLAAAERNTTPRGLKENAVFYQFLDECFRAPFLSDHLQRRCRARLGAFAADGTMGTIYPQPLWCERQGILRTDLQTLTGGNTAHIMPHQIALRR